MVHATSVILLHFATLVLFLTFINALSLLRCSRSRPLLYSLSLFYVGPSWEAAMIVTGCAEYPISNQVMEIVTSMHHANHHDSKTITNADATNNNNLPSAPVLMAPQCTQEVMHAIHTYTPKLHAKDPHRVQTTVDHYEPYIDFDLLLKQVGYQEQQQEQQQQL
jgi:hypothetical protein